MAKTSTSSPTSRCSAERDLLPMQFEIVNTSDPRNPFFWRMIDDAGEFLAYASASYPSVEACLDAIEEVRRSAGGGHIIDLTGALAQAPKDVLRPPPPDPRPEEIDAVMAVMAHGLLNAMSVVMGSVDLLDRGWDDLTGEQREQLFDSLKQQGVSVVDGLRDMMRGIPQQLADALDEIDAR